MTGNFLRNPIHLSIAPAAETIDPNHALTNPDPVSSDPCDPLSSDPGPNTPISSDPLELQSVYDHHFHIASLLSNSCHCSAILGELDDHTQSLAANIGRHLAIAQQVF